MSLGGHRAGKAGAGHLRRLQFLLPRRKVAHGGSLSDRHTSAEIQESRPGLKTYKKPY